MLLAFGPLYFAVASLTRATVLGAREQAARALGDAIAAHVGDALDTGGRAGVARAVREQRTHPDVIAVCAFDADGVRVACDGPAEVVRSMASPPPPGAERVRAVRDAEGRPLREFSTSFEGGSVVTRLKVDAQPGAGQALLPLVALYMGVFALALIVFACVRADAAHRPPRRAASSPRPTASRAARGRCAFPGRAPASSSTSVRACRR